MLPITSMVAALAAISLIALSLPVSLLRMKVGTEIGVGDDPALLRRIRAQGNFVEYVPLGLILLGLAEHRQVATALLWTIAALLVIGRALHAAGMLSGLTPVRAAGMVTTYGALLAGAGALVIQ